MKLFRRKFLWGFVFAPICAASIGSFANENPVFGELKSKFKATEKFSEISGQFEQKKHFQELDLNIVTSGNFKIVGLNSKSSSLEWAVVKPSPSKMCMDTEKIVTIGKQKQVIHLSEFDVKTYGQVVVMMNLLSMNFAYLEKKFSFSKDGKWYVLVPQGGQDASSDFLFEKIQLLLGEPGKIDKVQLLEKSKDQIDIQFIKVGLSKKSEKLECLK